MSIPTDVVNISLLLLFIFTCHRFRLRSSQSRQNVEAAKLKNVDLDAISSKAARRLRAKLVEVLPESVVMPDDAEKFQDCLKGYWAQQACEMMPACVIRPRNVKEVSRAIWVLKGEYDRRRWERRMRPRNAPETATEGLFAIRSGGHSPAAGASSVQGGALIDLSLFDEVTPAEDGKSVVIGAGCRWVDVYKALEAKGLAVAGGRNSAVGVGGLTLGGGLSFFSPRYGMVCSNIIEYEVALADGCVVKASETSFPDLWRVLKGGGNNFGIVTRFTARAFPSSNIWSGFLYLPSSQAPKVLSCFREFLDRTVMNDEGKTYDEFAAGPIACFTYLQQLGVEAIAVALTHTKVPEDRKQWPTCWRTSGFSKLWRFWSTCSVKSLCAATDEMSVLNPSGRRQEFATTTILNDRATLEAAHDAYRDAIGEIRKCRIKNMSWTLVLQPMLPAWVRKGDTNVLGLESCSNDALVNVSFTVNWALSQDDATVQRITRATIEQIDAYAEAHDRRHRYRYMNYCGGWQRPFDGYGQGNVELMREGACVGGFKVGE
ncbi:FAD-binding domain-containing protein [Ophiobolus disseminans]|uniref:FAD-binding domain-containing protein n=1 Tax=Ophiobolus disseminans TaxID=1469910 RepID=A0A6A7ACF7_9PLEO|nr:FAD-binding domain-containing protein [Ophiobolus disseminans]